MENDDDEPNGCATDGAAIVCPWHRRCRAPHRRGRPTGWRSWSLSTATRSASRCCFSFADHAGYDGVMLGLPGRAYQLKFTRHRNGSPGPAPSRDNLLVLYIPGSVSLRAPAGRLVAWDTLPVEPENPYWRDQASPSKTPMAGVVLAQTSGI